MLGLKIDKILGHKNIIITATTQILNVLIICIKDFCILAIIALFVKFIDIYVLPLLDYSEPSSFMKSIFEIIHSAFFIILYIIFVVGDVIYMLKRKGS